jgi:hypothetical protein
MVDISTPGKLLGKFGSKWMGQVSAPKFNTQYQEHDQQLQLQARQQQDQYGALLQAQMAGQGPSLAQDQLKAGLAQAQHAGMNTAASARGANVALAGRSAAQNTARVGMGAARDAAILRQQEQLAATQQYGGLLQSQREADLQARGLGVEMGKAQLSAESANTEGNAARGQKGAGGIAVLAGSLLSDPARKEDAVPVGGFTNPGMSGSTGFAQPSANQPRGFANPAAAPDPNAAPAPSQYQLQAPSFQGPDVGMPPAGQTPTAPPTQPIPQPQLPSSPGLYNPNAGGFQNPFATAMNGPQPAMATYMRPPGSGVAWKESIAPAGGTLARSDFNRFTDETVGSRLPHGPQPETLGVASTLADRGPSYPYGKPSTDQDQAKPAKPMPRTMAQKFWAKLTGAKSSAELEREDEAAKPKKKDEDSVWSKIGNALVSGGNAVSGGEAVGSDPDMKEQASQASHPLVYGAAQAQPYKFRYKPEAAAQEGVSTEERYGMMASKKPGNMAENPVYAPTVIKNPDGYDRIDAPQALMANVAVTTDVARKQAEDSRRISELEALLEAATKAAGGAGEQARGKRFTRKDVQEAPASPKGKGRSIRPGATNVRASMDVEPLSNESSPRPSLIPNTMGSVLRKSPIARELGEDPEQRFLDDYAPAEKYKEYLRRSRSGGLRDNTELTRRQAAEYNSMTQHLQQHALDTVPDYNDLPDMPDEDWTWGAEPEARPDQAAKLDKRQHDRSRAETARPTLLDTPAGAWVVQGGKRVRAATKNEARALHEGKKTAIAVRIRESMDEAEGDEALDKRIRAYADQMSGASTSSAPSPKWVHQQLMERGVNISLKRVKEALRGGVYL